mgnify:CR=1 FL=1
MQRARRTLGYDDTTGLGAPGQRTVAQKRQPARRRCRLHCTAPSWRTASAVHLETQTTATSSPIAYTSLLDFLRHKEQPCGVKVYRDMRRADSSYDSSRGNPRPIFLNSILSVTSSSHDRHGPGCRLKCLFSRVKF